MAEEFNEEKIREELLELYEEFLKKPGDVLIRDKMIAYDRDYWGAPYFNDVLVKKAISDDVAHALGVLLDVFQYGLGIRNDKELLEMAKVATKELEENL